MAAPQVTPQVTPQVSPHVTPHVTPQVVQLLRVLDGEMDRERLQAELGLRVRKNFWKLYQKSALEECLIEMIYSRKAHQPLTSQAGETRYRTTEVVADRCHHLRRIQQSSVSEDILRQVAARGQYQELQAGLRW